MWTCIYTSLSAFLACLSASVKGSVQLEDPSSPGAFHHSLLITYGAKFHHLLNISSLFHLLGHLFADRNHMPERSTNRKAAKKSVQRKPKCPVYRRTYRTEETILLSCISLTGFFFKLWDSVIKLLEQKISAGLSLFFVFLRSFKDENYIVICLYFLVRLQKVIRKGLATWIEQQRKQKPE